MKLAKFGAFMIFLAAGYCGVAMHAQAASGSDTCKQGYVWREAFSGDHVCVTPSTRAQVASDNGHANARRQPGGGVSGSDTCRQGYVWREARPDDRVCVTPENRAQATSDNRLAASRVDKTGHTCVLFEHRDYGGSRKTLQNGDDLKMIDSPDLGTSDGIHNFMYDASWNDNVSSFKVGPTCTLTLWEHVGRGGHHFRANKSFKYVGDSWNDKASEATCECAGLPNL